MYVQYRGQAEDEKTLFVIYKHWMAVFPFIFVSFIMLGLSLLAFGLSPVVDLTGPLSSIPLATFGSIGLIISALFFLTVIWIWRNNRIIVTDQQIVDVDQFGVFNHKQSTLSLGVIQDVSVEVKGPLQTILRYGTMNVQTAGNRENFVFDYIPSPFENERRILDAHQEYLQRKKRKPAQTPGETAALTPLDKL